LAENTKQLRWILMLIGNLAALFRDAADVFIGGDLFWYPVEGRPDVRTAPDVLVVFGRPKGDRRSYMQWEEGGVPMTVVFEILSPGNTVQEMDDKLAFYEEHGVEEYYFYDPDTNRLKVFLRRGDVLRRVRPADGFVSPRLGIPTRGRFCPSKKSRAPALRPSAGQSRRRSASSRRSVGPRGWWNSAARSGSARPPPKNWPNWNASKVNPLLPLRDPTMTM
jgi:Uma2 family endonuclease